MDGDVPHVEWVAGSHVPAPATVSYPVRDGNLVQPLIDAVPTFTRIADAVDAAKASVWVVAAFLWPAFRLPGGRGTVFDLLDRAAARGLDVRMLVWRPEPGMYGLGKVFVGTEADRELLRSRGSRFAIRWDRAHPRFAQHQKSWLIDAGEPTETAFVGGINLTASIPHVPGHPGGGQVHDVYVEIAGPAASDVHHNFVQRWNEASERLAEDGVWPNADAASDLPFPRVLSPARGTSRVQIQRTVHPGRYTDATPAPGASGYDIAQGERSILDQYLAAIDAARTSIHIENQAIPIPLVAERLERALRRGVAVVAIVPGVAEEGVRTARRHAAHRESFDRLAALGRHERFVLAGLAGRGASDGRSEVHVHAKVMVVDDAWATIGSCNLHRHSLLGNTEMNASIWDPVIARALRCALMAEHLDIDTGGMDALGVFEVFQRVARDNRQLREAGSSDWQGIVHSLDPGTYGR